MRVLLVAPALLAFCGCSIADSYAVQHAIHQTLPAAGVRYLRVDNISGTVTVAGGKGDAVQVNANEHAGSDDAIGRTQVKIARSGDEISVQTHIQNSGFFSGGGASVDYTIDVPRGIAVNVSNVSGRVTVSNVDGDVHIDTISGAVMADLGRVAAKRNIDTSTVSGSITLRIAADSDARLQTSSVSGDTTAFFPIDTNQSPGSNSANGRIGSGSANISAKTISGGITLEKSAKS